MRSCPLLLLKGAFLAAFFLSLVELFLLRREKARTAALRAELAEISRRECLERESERQHLNKIHRLNRELREWGRREGKTRQAHLAALRWAFGWLGRIYEESVSEERLDRTVRNLLGETGVAPEDAAALVSFLNENLDGVADRLQQDIPALGEADILLFCYEVVGYDASLISRLMGMKSKNTVYSRKKRLRDRIRKLPPAKAVRYLELLP